MSKEHVPAIVLEQRGQKPIMATVVAHDPGVNEVRIRIVASGICHTDFSWVRDAPACPVILGHEGAGIVESIGENVTRVQPGDHVVVNWRAKCYRCRRCVSGQIHLCERVQTTAAPRMFWEGAPLNLMLNAGTFCPIVIVPETGAIPIRKDIPLEKAALLGCGVATGVGAVFNAARVQPGESVVVIGTGGVGLNVIQAARLANAGRVIAVDVREDRLAQAQAFGATDSINSGTVDPIASVQDITGGRGVEHVFEVVGAPRTMNQGISMLTRGGVLTILGGAPRDAQLTINPRQLQSNQQTINACIYGDIRAEIDLPMYANWYMDGSLKLDELHTATIALEEVLTEFSDQGHHDGIRTVILFD